MTTSVRPRRTEGGAPAPAPSRSRSGATRRRQLLSVAVVVVAAALSTAVALVTSAADRRRPAADTPPAVATDAALFRRPLPWAPPRLIDPRVVVVDGDHTTLTLDDDHDYLIRMPTVPVLARGGLVIAGGHDVVLVGGEVRVPDPSTGATGLARRGLYLTGQTGTVHVEGLRLSGVMTDAINLDETRGATVQLENVVAERVEGSRDGWHADLLQTWAGPTRLLVDGLVGETDYQGLFLTPTQRSRVRPDRVDLRDVDLLLARGSAYALWRDQPGGWPLTTERVTVRPVAGRSADLLFWPRPSAGTDASWQGVTVADPSGWQPLADYNSGTDYRSPGYTGDPT